MPKKNIKPRHRGALVVYGDWLRMLAAMRWPA